LWRRAGVFLHCGVTATRPPPDAPAHPDRGRRGGAIELRDLAKSFGSVTALAGIDLVIDPGEFFSLLGPSGCGKTTSLRLIAGFEAPTRGAILLDGTDMAAVAPHKRPVNTVFQSYALFPHLDVERNVGYGLRWREGISRAEHRRRVGAALELVRLSGFERRRPHQLSGGQQQRVALARALVLEPSVLLLDEPLGALDAKLRKELQLELLTLQREVGITFVYVTHDQEEALTMSDRLAVMRRGQVAQVGTPREVYEEPADAEVADFLGVANLLDVIVESDGRIVLGGATLTISAGPPGPATLLLRPERVRLRDANAAGSPSTFRALVERLVYLGATTQVHVRLADGSAVCALVPNADGPPALSAGDVVAIEVPADAVRVLPLGSSASRATEGETE
jgi:spermidine/putrescine transport system ATP-binding protein